VRSSIAAALIAFAFGVGYWAGGIANDDSNDRVERSRSDESPELRFARRVAAEEREALQSQLREARAATEQLRTRLQRYEPPEGETVAPEPGTRLADGTIVGGARWNDGFNRLASGFLDSMLGTFIQQAKLSPEQERRVRSLILKESGKFLQVSADFTNGDVDGEAAYEQLEGLSADLRAKVGEMLDEQQRANFGTLQQGIRNIMRSQVVHNEMATLKSTLEIDPDQEQKILAIVEERYRRVEEGTTIPIPNVFFKPLRRERDQPIYDETADAIRAILTAEQAARFNQFESQAPDAPFLYRAQLVPR
jgi:hypothetical protein